MSAVAADTITPEQMRMLHGVAKRRGFDHAELRTVAGVTSLKHLSKSDAHALIDKLKDDRPDGGVVSASSRSPRRPKGIIPIGGASKRQREYMTWLFDELGWDAGTRNGWVWKRHQVRSVDDPHMLPAVASEAIVQLEKALSKIKPFEDSEGRQRGSHG